MQAADFLQDEALLGSVVRALSHAFVPEPTAKKRERFIKPWRRGLPVISYLPSGKQRARACKVRSSPQAFAAPATVSSFFRRHAFQSPGRTRAGRL